MWDDEPTEEERAAWNKLTFITGEIKGWSIDEDIRNADWLKQKPSKTEESPKAEEPQSDQDLKAATKRCGKK